MEGEGGLVLVSSAMPYHVTPDMPLSLLWTLVFFPVPKVASSKSIILHSGCLTEAHGELLKSNSSASPP